MYINIHIHICIDPRDKRTNVGDQWEDWLMRWSAKSLVCVELSSTCVQWPPPLSYNVKAIRSTECFYRCHWVDDGNYQQNSKIERGIFERAVMPFCGAPKKTVEWMRILHEWMCTAWRERMSNSIGLYTPHICWAASKRFLPAGGTFRTILTSESHSLQPVLVLSVHWWPTPVSVGGLLELSLKSLWTIYEGLVVKFHPAFVIYTMPRFSSSCTRTVQLRCHEVEAIHFCVEVASSMYILIDYMETKGKVGLMCFAIT